MAYVRKGSLQVMQRSGKVRFEAFEDQTSGSLAGRGRSQAAYDEGHEKILLLATCTSGLISGECYRRACFPARH